MNNINYNKFKSDLERYALLYTFYNELSNFQEYTIFFIRKFKKYMSIFGKDIECNSSNYNFKTYPIFLFFKVYLTKKEQPSLFLHNYNDLFNLQFNDYGMLLFENKRKNIIKYLKKIRLEPDFASLNFIEEKYGDFYEKNIYNYIEEISSYEIFNEITLNFPFLKISNLENYKENIKKEYKLLLLMMSTFRKINNEIAKNSSEV